jgi:alpha,alpha-trehalase
MAGRKEAERTAESLKLFEGEHGFAVTEPTDGVEFQWQWPNMWPPLAYTTGCGLARYGLHDAARRVARKYVQTCVDLWKETGRLWEKLDVTTGRPAGGEYDAQPMMGWTAGAFVALADYLMTRPGK